MMRDSRPALQRVDRVEGVEYFLLHLLQGLAALGIAMIGEERIGA